MAKPIAAQLEKRSGSRIEPGGKRIGKVTRECGTFRDGIVAAVCSVLRWLVLSPVP